MILRVLSVLIHASRHLHGEGDPTDGIGGSLPLHRCGAFLAGRAPAAPSGVPLSRGLHLVLGPKSPNLVSANTHSRSLGRLTTSRVLVRGTRALSAGLDCVSQQQSLPRHPLRGGAGSPAREPAQAPEVSAGLRGRAVPGGLGWRGPPANWFLSLRFLETVELQISLKNYDPQKDKRFSGTVRLAPF